MFMLFQSVLRVLTSQFLVFIVLWEVMALAGGYLELLAEKEEVRI